MVAVAVAEGSVYSQTAWHFPGGCLEPSASWPSCRAPLQLTESSLGQVRLLVSSWLPVGSPRQQRGRRGLLGGSEAPGRLSSLLLPAPSPAARSAALLREKRNPSPPPTVLDTAGIYKSATGPQGRKSWCWAKNRHPKGHLYHSSLSLRGGFLLGTEKSETPSDRHPHPSPPEAPPEFRASAVGEKKPFAAVSPVPGTGPGTQ